MYVFGMAVLIALGVFAVASIADRYLSVAREYWTIALVGLGIGAAWLIDFNMWYELNLWVRADWIGKTLTGVILGALALVIHGLAHLFLDITRAVEDSNETIETETTFLRRVG